MGIKQYDVDGVADNLQLGKRGPSIKVEDGSISHRAQDGTFTVSRAAPGVGDNDLITMSQLTGLSASVQAEATTMTDMIGAQASMIQTQQVALATLQALVEKLMPAAPDVVDIGPTLAAGTLLGTLKEGMRVSSISIEVTEAFDGDAGLTIGDGATADFYMDADHSDLGFVGTYTMTPPDSAPDRMITAALTGSATKGKATVRLVYAS